MEREDVRPLFEMCGKLRGGIHNSWKNYGTLWPVETQNVFSYCNQTVQEPRTCETLNCYGTSLPPPWVITTVVILIANFDSICKRAEGKMNLFYFQGVSIATPHIILHPALHSGEQRHLEHKGSREGDRNLTSIIVPGFRAGAAADLVLSWAWIKNSIFCCVT